MFTCCIMNPPYENSLHLKILTEILQHCETTVNISPCRWLEDPLAKYKKNSEFNKFENSVSKKIESIDIVPQEQANNLFDIEHTDLAIYVLGQGGYDYNKLSQMDPIAYKIFSKCQTGKTMMDISTAEGYRGKHDGIFGVINSHRNECNKFISDKYELFITYRETHGNKLIFFNSDIERQNCFKYLTSNILRYYGAKVRKNQRIPWQFVPVVDFTKTCDDKFLAEYFGITDDELKIIKQTEQI